MSSNLVHIAGATYINEPIQQSAYGDFEWALEMFDGETDTTPTDLTGCEFSFVVLDLDGTALDTYTPTVADNLVTLSIPLEDWAEWTKNCNLKYRYTMTKADGTRFPLFAGTFMLVQ